MDWLYGKNEAEIVEKIFEKENKNNTWRVFTLTDGNYLVEEEKIFGAFNNFRKAKTYVVYKGEEIKVKFPKYVLILLK